MKKDSPILAGREDGRVFFGALLKTAEPNAVLIKATKAFKKITR